MVKETFSRTGQLKLVGTEHIHVAKDADVRFACEGNFHTTWNEFTLCSTLFIIEDNIILLDKY